MVLAFLHSLATLHGHQHKHHCQVDCDDCLKEESLEVDGGVAHDVEEDGGQEHRQEDIHQSPAQEHVHPDTELTSDVTDKHGLVPEVMVLHVTCFE